MSSLPFLSLFNKKVEPEVKQSEKEILGLASFPITVHINDDPESWGYHFYNTRYENGILYGTNAIYHVPFKVLDGTFEEKKAKLSAGIIGLYLKISWYSKWRFLDELDIHVFVSSIEDFKSNNHCFIGAVNFWPNNLDKFGAATSKTDLGDANNTYCGKLRFVRQSY